MTVRHGVVHSWLAQCSRQAAVVAMAQHCSVRQGHIQADMFLHVLYRQYNPISVDVQSVPACSVNCAVVQQVSITLIATGFGSGVVEAALRPAARRQPQQQQQQQQHPPPRQVPVERCVVYPIL